MTPAQLREAILGTPDLKIVPVDLPEGIGAWPTRLHVREMPATANHEISRIALAMQKDGGNIPDEAIGRIVARCTCDENGDRIFTDADAAVLTQRNPKVIDALFLAALKVSGVMNDEVEGEKKGSPTTQSAVSSTA